MNAIATGIGWVVIIGIVLVVINAWLKHLEFERAKPQQIWKHEERLAARKIFRSTKDENVRDQIKMSDGGRSAVPFRDR